MYVISWTFLIHECENWTIINGWHNFILTITKGYKSIEVFCQKSALKICRNFMRKYLPSNSFNQAYNFTDTVGNINFVFSWIWECLQKWLEKYKCMATSQNSSKWCTRKHSWNWSYNYWEKHNVPCDSDLKHEVGYRKLSTEYLGSHSLEKLFQSC